MSSIFHSTQLLSTTATEKNRFWSGTEAQWWQEFHIPSLIQERRRLGEVDAADKLASNPRALIYLHIKMMWGNALCTKIFQEYCQLPMAEWKVHSPTIIPENHPKVGYRSHEEFLKKARQGHNSPDVCKRKGAKLCMEQFQEKMALHSDQWRDTARRVHLNIDEAIMKSLFHPPRKLFGKWEVCGSRW